MSVQVFKGPVYLEPIEHVYWHRDTGERFTSVTTTMAQIEHPFMEDDIALAISKQRDDRKKEAYIGLNKEQIIELWRKINFEATEYGTMVHEILERYLLADKFYFPDDEFENKVIRAYDAAKFNEGDVIWPERIMFSEEFALAGTADVVIDIGDDMFDIGDWKGLPITTPILTSNNGWKTMETITIKDTVYDKDGVIVPVLHTSNIKNKKCYKISFDNNESIISDYEHRWLISFYRNKKFKDKVMTTEELYYYVNDMNNSNKRWSHKIPKIKIAKPLQNNEKKLPIDPYILGLWLGDGHSANGMITNMYDDIWDEIKRRGYSIGDDVSQGGAGKAVSRTVFGLHTELRKLNLLKNKHIPSIFLTASYNQRLDILRGFMDSDGYYNENRKRFVMSTTRSWQSKAFLQVISTLGLKGTLISYKKKANGVIIDVDDVLFSTESLNPFLIRHQDKHIFNKNNKNMFKNIKTVDPVESVPTRCIEVGSKSHTFLYGDTFSITHNTNKKIDYFSPFRTYLKPPFTHIQQCNYNLYSIQLSTYAYMYELETGRKCRHIWIGYWDRETETIRQIPIFYSRELAKKLLHLHKLNLSL